MSAHDKFIFFVEYGFGATALALVLLFLVLSGLEKRVKKIEVRIKDLPPQNVANYSTKTYLADYKRALGDDS